MAETEDQPAISQDTIDMIEGQVKKGKARKFFLIYKGATIKTLVVFKKGAFGPKVMEAKKNGFKGEVASGVVSGSGKNLFFYLPGNPAVAASMKVEGVLEKPPTKKSKLREFLNENELNFKPSFHIITQVSDAPDPDSETDTPTAPPPPGSEVGNDEQTGDSLHGSAANTDAAELPTQTTASDQADLAAKFKARLTALLPGIKHAAGTTHGETAKQKVNDAAQYARQQNYADANNMLDEAEEALRTPAPQAETVDNAGKATKLVEALKKLKPFVEKAVISNANLKGELFATMTQIAGEIKSQRFEEAKQNITDFTTQLKSLLSQQPVPTSDANQQNRLAEFNERRDALESRLLQAQKADREKAVKLGAVWDYANSQAEAGNLDNAWKALERLTDAIETTLASQSTGDTERLGIEKGIVEKRKFLLTRFRQIPVDIQPHLNSVKLKITAENADEDPEELVTEIEDALQVFFDELQDEVDDCINAGDTSRIKGLRNRVTSNELVQHLLKNPFVDGSQFQSAILSAIDEVEQVLGS